MSTVPPAPLRLVHTLDAVPVSVSRGRAQALAVLSGRRGFDIHIGIELKGCRHCGTRRVASALSGLLRSARRVGRFSNRRRTYHVFVPNSARHLRIITRPGAGGRHSLITVQVAKPSARLPHYLPELDWAELEAETKVLPMNAKVDWEPQTQSLKQLQTRHKNADHREQLVYVGVDAKGNPIKVGQTTNFAERYYPKQLQRLGIDKFHVGRVLDKQGNALMGPYITSAERLIARQLNRMGVPLSKTAHIDPDPTQSLVTTRGKQIELRNATPESIRTRRAAELKAAPKQTRQVRRQLNRANQTDIKIAGQRKYELELNNGHNGSNGHAPWSAHP